MSSIGSDDGVGVSVALPWRIFWPIAVFSSTLMFPWLFPIILTVAIGVWWTRGKSKAFLFSMALGLLAGIIHAAVLIASLLRDRQIRTASIANEPLGTKMELLRQSQLEALAIYWRVVVPIGSALIAGIALAVLFDYLARPRALKAFEEARTVSRLPRFARVPLGCMGFIAILSLAFKPTVVTPPMAREEKIWRNLDDLVRHPDAFPDRRATQELPSARRLAGPCITLAGLLRSGSSTHGFSETIDSAELASICARAAIDGSNGFDDDRARRVFAHETCRPGNWFARQLLASDTVHFTEFCKDGRQ